MKTTAYIIVLAVTVAVTGMLHANTMCPKQKCDPGAKCFTIGECAGGTNIKITASDVIKKCGPGGPNDTCDRQDNEQQCSATGDVYSAVNCLGTVTGTKNVTMKFKGCN
jgi:hypothetical protein